MESIRRAFQQFGLDENLVEEIAARVWYALVKDECRLLKLFDPSRGASFATYTSLIAKSLTYQHFRAERRRRHREAVASKALDVQRADDRFSRIDFEEVFMESLSPRELEYFYDYLLADGDSRQAGISRQYSWQLRRRVLVKLRTFLAVDEDES